MAPASASQRQLSAAVQSATTDLLVLIRAVFGTSRGAKPTVDRLAVGALRSRLAAFPQVAVRIQRRVAAAGAPAAFVSWPLGYQAHLVTPSQAVVSIWHLDVAATTALGLAGAEYQTTIFHMAWARNSWRIQSVTARPGPTPPTATAPAAEVDAFALAANSFTRYRYGP
jgi:hypothetical protein